MNTTSINTKTDDSLLSTTTTNNSSCSTDWYLEDKNKFEISIKGMMNNSFEHLNRYNYPITRNDFRLINKTIQNDLSSNSLQVFINSIGYTCLSKKQQEMITNRMNIKGSSSQYVSTSHLKLNNNYCKSRNQQDFFNFSNSNKTNKYLIN